jgi:hypothetical protein
MRFIKKWQPIKAMAHDKPYQRTGQSMPGIVKISGLGFQLMNIDIIVVSKFY